MKTFNISYKGEHQYIQKSYSKKSVMDGIREDIAWGVITGDPKKLLKDFSVEEKK